MPFLTPRPSLTSRPPDVPNREVTVARSPRRRRKGHLASVPTPVTVPTSEARRWPWGRVLLLVLLAGGAFGAVYLWTQARIEAEINAPPPGMVWIDGGTFVMGSTGK